MANTKASGKGSPGKKWKGDHGKKFQATMALKYGYGIDPEQWTPEQRANREAMHKKQKRTAKANAAAKGDDGGAPKSTQAQRDAWNAAARLKRDRKNGEGKKVSKTNGHEYNGHNGSNGNGHASDEQVAGLPIMSSGDIPLDMIPPRPAKVATRKPYTTQAMRMQQMLAEAGLTREPAQDTGQLKERIALEFMRTLQMILR